ncbi:ParB/RepB/Spo0J family partition protein [Arthrobacter zhaoxinii]|uniref:ParB/RepB/Spo0J family partition protein n=1 Tax=Arthrobacter zhaoxinii TaxID=2964616 RepID=UPI0021040D7B|nr:ParB/RepB/Spo0J family partition protein [Arthrobacter zhaoxinii]MCQ2000160.1 ParB/RepB/Spo0J family partition protein [Arthrobacter zhaoxinii]
MAEKRRGLGRGLGALIPSSAEPAETETPSQANVASGRPVDLFFAAADEPRASASGSGPRRGAGINKEALRGPAKKSTTRSSTARSSAQDDAAKDAELPEVSAAAAPEAVQPATLASSGSTGEPSPATGNQAPKRAEKAAGSTTAGRAAEDTATAPEVTENKSAPDAATASTNGSKDPAAAVEPMAAADRSDPQEVAGQPTDDAGRKQAADVSRETSRSDDGGTGLVQVPGAIFAELPIDSIHPNRKQPRSVFDEDDMAELVHSIREIGVLQPIVVRPSPEDDAEHPYELVMGERRWRASREAGLDFVPAIIRSTQDVDLLRDALLENLHRSQLNPLEEAAAYQQLLDDFECSHEELADRIGRSRPQVTNTLRLMKLPPLVQRRLAAGVVSAGHARALLGLGDPAEMEKLAQKIVAEGLSVRATEEIVSLADGLRKPAKSSKPKVGARHERLDYLATSLSDRLDTNVKITLGARKGKVSIEFASVDDLNRIMGVLAAPSE